MLRPVIARLACGHLLVVKPNNIPGLRFLLKYLLQVKPHYVLRLWMQYRLGLPGIGCHSRLSYYPDYHWLLSLFTGAATDKHLVLGDINFNPDIETVAGTTVKFCEDYQNSDYVALADEDGMIYVINTALTGPGALCSRWSVHKNAIFDLEWLPGTSRIITASGHQIACLVDTKTQQTIDTFKGHTSSLKTVASRKTDPFVFATGGRDGCISIWDQRVSRRDNSIPCCNEIRNAHSTAARCTRKSTSQSITGLCFQDENTLISSASNDGNIKVWDLRRSYKTLKADPQPKYTLTYHGKSLKQVGYSGLTMDHSKSRLFANCTDDSIYQFNAINFSNEVISKSTGHKNKTFFVKSCVSPDDRFLLTGSSDNNAVIYDLSSQGSRSFILQSHTEEVTSVAWCKYDIKRLVTISDDDSLIIWRLGDAPPADQIIGRSKACQSDNHLTGGKRRRAFHHAQCRYKYMCQSPVTTCLKSYPHRDNSESNSSRLSSGLEPWPILNGLKIQPRISSPKKILISPRKSCIGQSDQLNHASSSPSCQLMTNNNNTVLNSSATDSTADTLTRVKRKLVESSLHSSTSADLQHTPSPSSRNPRIISPSPNCATLSPIRINNSSRNIVNVTPTSVPTDTGSGTLQQRQAPRCSASLNFSSPTANLPNSVLDAQTPTRYDKENQSRIRKPDDWLSQYSKEKRRKLNNSSSLGMSSSPEIGVSSAVTPSRPSQHRTRSNSKTPTARKKPASAQTLMNYFSPTSQTNNDKDNSS